MLKMMLIGNLGRDAEVRDAGGQKVIAFTVAHSEKYTDRNGQQQERTQWVRCSYWRQEGQTRVADYLKKGQKVYVEGFPSVSTYTAKDGTTGASLELRVLNLELLGDSQGQQQAAPKPTQQAQPASNPYANEPAPQVDDDLPF